MAGKQQRSVRKPATKFGHLQKKIGQQKTGRNVPPPKPKTSKLTEQKR